MKHHLFLSVSIICGALLLSLMSAVAASPDTQATKSIDTAIEAFQSAFQAARETGQWPSAEQRGAMVDKALTGIDVSALSLDDLETLLTAMPVVYSGEAGAADAKLAELAKANDADGALAAALRFRLMGPEMSQADTVKALTGLFQHPGLADAWQQGKGYVAFNAFYSLDEDQLRALQPAFVGLEPMVSADMPALFYTRLGYAFLTFANLPDETLAKDREPLRLALVNGIDAKLKSPDLSEDDAKALKDTRARLDGAFARGQLLDHPAPELDFIWWSNPSDPDESYAKLSDLKGKVVVLDFWATWCGPCVGSFPHVKDLQAHYDGYDVAIVGVTSLQGAHYPGDERGKIDTTDNPDLEMSLMKEFIKDKGITWRIAFSKQPVFNPDFGVTGIPHMAIIDVNGVVRYRGLHPAMPMEVKTSKIDALLAEAGKPVPPAPEPKDDAADEADAPSAE